MNWSELPPSQQQQCKKINNNFQISNIATVFEIEFFLPSSSERTWRNEMVKQKESKKTDFLLVLRMLIAFCADLVVPRFVFADSVHFQCFYALFFCTYKTKMVLIWYFQWNSICLYYYCCWIDEIQLNKEEELKRMKKKWTLIQSLLLNLNNDSLSRLDCGQQ